MKRCLPLVLAVWVLLVTGGCTSLETRIKSHQAQFDAWPAEVQEKIRAGRIDLGFTPDQVRVVLGEPAQRFQRKTAKGESEVWSYRGSATGISFGLGVGSYRGSGAYAGGVMYDQTTYGADDERIRVVFEKGVVTSVEKRTK